MITHNLTRFQELSEQEQAALNESIANTELTVKLTWGQCSIIEKLLVLADEIGDLEEYTSDLMAIEHAITDARIANLEAGLR